METLLLVVESGIAYIIPQINIKSIVQKYLENNNGKKFSRKFYGKCVRIDLNISILTQ